MFTPQAVSGGEITLTESVTKAQIGLPFTYKLQPMRPDYKGGQGTAMGSKVKINKAIVSYYESLNSKYTDGTSDIAQPDWRTTEVYGTAPALFTGEKDTVVNLGIDADNMFTIEGSDPLPCTVRSIVFKYSVMG